MDQDYTPNSEKYKAERKEAEEKNLEKVTVGSAKKKEKSWYSKFKEVFLPDGPDNIGNYIWVSVLIPAIKNVISDAVNGILYGDSRGGRVTRADRTSYHQDYSGISSGRSQNYSNTSSGSRQRTKEYSDIIFESRGDAEIVLKRMDECLTAYGMVSILDMEDLAGVTGDYTDNKYGWFDLRGARVVAVRNGFVIDLPKAVPLTND